jgi:hypothetical protein
MPLRRRLQKLFLRVTAAGVAATALALVGPMSAHAAACTEAISSYDTRIEIRADGSMRITETISYDFAGGHRHGIFRRIPTRHHFDSTRDRIYPIDEVGVRMDGAPAPFEHDHSGG